MKKNIIGLAFLTTMLISCSQGNQNQNSSIDENVSNISNNSTIEVSSSNPNNSSIQEQATNVQEFLKEDYADFVNKNIICENPTSLSNNTNVNLKDVNSYGTKYLLLHFDGYIKSFNINDIKLQAYNSDWYSLNPVIQDNIEIDSYVTTTNQNGETIIIIKIKQELKGTRLKTNSQIKELSQKEIDEKITRANNIITWQLDNGGWDKDKGMKTQATRPWDGKEAKNQFSNWKSKDGLPLGTIDNSTTYTQMREIATAYYYSHDEKYKESFEKGMHFLDLLQYESGGFAQVYPRRGNYSDYVTLNDNAMASVLIMLEQIKNKEYPFNNGIISQETYDLTCKMIDDGIDYLLKSQITSNGKKAAWCAQHDPNNYKPLSGRAYEPISISGSESLGVIKFLMNQYDKPECVKAAEDALEWFASVKQENLGFDKNTAPYFYEKPGSTLWYRFYEIDTNKGIFGDRDGKVYYDISQISEERRTGYSWSGNWPEKLLNTFSKYGYYANKILVSVVSNNSKVDNGTLNLTSNALSPIENKK